MKVADGVREEPLLIRAGWSTQEYATRKRTPTTYMNSTLSVEVESQSDDVLVARVLRSPRFIRFGKFYRHSAGRVHTLNLSVRWHDYGSSDWVSISFTGGNDLSVEDRELGLDPQQWVNVVRPSDALTGTVISLAEAPRIDDLEVQIVCLAKADTVNTHGRWALKPSLRESLLAEYAFLASGAVSGVR